MAKHHVPFYHRILFRFLLPVVVVGVVCCTLLVSYMSAPMKAFLIRQFDANLQLAATMGLRTCEKNFNYLLELRLEKDLEMNQSMQSEALEEIKAISRHFPQIHLMVVQSGQSIQACSIAGAPHNWRAFPIDGLNDTAIAFDFDGKAVRAHLQYFPFWDWQVISFVFEQDYRSPVRMAYTITYLSAAFVFLAILITLLFVYYLFINRPLNQLVTVTDDVAGGRLVKIDRIAPNEFGRLMMSFNAMIDSLENEKERVNGLIHELKESEARFKALHNASFGGIFIHDQGLVLDCNQGLLEMTGYSEAEMIGMDGYLMIAERSRQAVKDKVAAGYEQPYEVYGVRKNGEEFPLRIQARNIPYKGKRVRFVEYRDITEQKQAEQDLRHLKNYLSNIIDSMPSVIVGVDRDGNVTQWNRQAEKTTGVSFAKARSQPLGTVLPRMFDKMDRIKASIRDRRVVRDLKVASRHGGETRYEDVIIFPLIANGVEGAVIRVDDVTERVRLEEMMIQSEKMLSVGGLAAGMAHEINNPLAGILQNTAVLKNRLIGDLPANREAAEAAGTSMAAIDQYLHLRKLPDMLQNISVSGNRAAVIVKNMLSFARKSDKVVSTNDLGSLLDQTLELVQTDYDMKKNYDFKKIAIRREYADTAISVPCEASKIQQVFMNILKNGAEAMAEAEDMPFPPTFVLRVQDDGAWMRVEIEDNGPGMDEATRRRIFEPFYTTKPVGRGTGLGLSVSYFIITEDHGGEMRVHTTEDKGTRFVIRLPKEGKLD